MKIKEILTLLEAELITGDVESDFEVMSACGADLMSDVMAFAKENVMLLTGLINPQVIRTAEMMDIRVIVFVRGKAPTQEMVRLAEEKQMILMRTAYPMFQACGRLYHGGLRNPTEE